MLTGAQCTHSRYLFQHSVRASKDAEKKMEIVGTSPAGWKHLYQLALFETDRRKIAARVAEARIAISMRLSDRASSPPSSEVDSLKSAQRFLRILEKVELEGS